jgi:hypothetical protein
MEPAFACYPGSAVDPAAITQTRDLSRERDGRFSFDPADWSRVAVGRPAHSPPPSLSPSSPG